MHSGAGCIETKYQNKNACVLAFLTEPYLTQLHCTKVCFDTQSGSMTISHFDLVSWLLALEPTELVSKPVTQMAVELINIHLISVQQKR